MVQVIVGVGDETERVGAWLLICMLITIVVSLWPATFNSTDP